MRSSSLNPKDFKDGGATGLAGAAEAKARMATWRQFWRVLAKKAVGCHVGGFDGGEEKRLESVPMGSESGVNQQTLS
jgi:hypothetical protein